jgi:hypothetical protein
MIRRDFCYSIDLTVVARKGNAGLIERSFLPYPIVDSRCPTSNSSKTVGTPQAVADGLNERENGQRNKRASKHGSRKVQPISQDNKKTDCSKQIAPASFKPDARSTPAPKVTKVAKIVDMMKRAGGATLTELMFATGWQSHSIRAFVSTLSKRDKIRIRSMRNPKGERVYEILD